MRREGGRSILDQFCLKNVFKTWSNELTNHLNSTSFPIKWGGIWCVRLQVSLIKGSKLLWGILNQKHFLSKMYGWPHERREDGKRKKNRRKREWGRRKEEGSLLPWQGLSMIRTVTTWTGGKKRHSSRKKEEVSHRKEKLVLSEITGCPLTREIPEPYFENNSEPKHSTKFQFGHPLETRLGDLTLCQMRGSRLTFF